MIVNFKEKQMSLEDRVSVLERMVEVLCKLVEVRDQDEDNDKNNDEEEKHTLEGLVVEVMYTTTGISYEVFAQVGFGEYTTFSCDHEGTPRCYNRTRNPVPLNRKVSESELIDYYKKTSSKRFVKIIEK